MPLQPRRRPRCGSKEFLPGGQNDFRVRRSDGIKLTRRIRSGLREERLRRFVAPVVTVQNPMPQSARGVDSIIAARSAAEKEARAAKAAAAAAATALPLIPGAALADGQKGAYVYRPAGIERPRWLRQKLREGWHLASCVRDRGVPSRSLQPVGREVRPA
jgi:hypothetical protein